jgi:hypothetical protein
MTEFILQRHSDPSGVSGTGIVAEGCEFSDGAVAVHWLGQWPSTTVWGDIRSVEAIHGHDGATTVTYVHSDRLARAYKRVMPFALNASMWKPQTIEPHPEHLDRLRLDFGDDWPAWRFWIALLDGSTDAAICEEVAGGIEHRWTDPEGLLWLTWLAPDAATEYPDHDCHDPRD